MQMRSTQAGCDVLKRLVSRVRQISDKRLVKMPAIIAIAIMLWSTGVGCLICCARASIDQCCRTRRVDGTESTASGNSLNIDQRSCCNNKGAQTAAELSTSKDKAHCCSGEARANGPSTLAQLVDHRTIASSMTSQPIRISNVRRLSGCATRAPVRDRGSTHLLCCVLLI